MSKGLVAILIVLAAWTVESYRLDELVQRLNGYEKKWVSGVNTKFIDMTLLDTMKLMGTKLPIKPEDRLPER